MGGGNGGMGEDWGWGGAAVAGVAVWEPALAEHGALLIRERGAWVEAMEGRFEQLCRDIGETARVQVRYAGSIDATSDLAAALAAALEEKRGLDLRRGLTHAGPHRDDLAITITGPDGTARDLRAF